MGNHVRYAQWLIGEFSSFDAADGIYKACLMFAGVAYEGWYAGGLGAGHGFLFAIFVIIWLCSLCSCCDRARGMPVLAEEVEAVPDGLRMLYVSWIHFRVIGLCRLNSAFTAALFEFNAAIDAGSSFPAEGDANTTLAVVMLVGNDVQLVMSLYLACAKFEIPVAQVLASLVLSKPFCFSSLPWFLATNTTATLPSTSRPFAVNACSLCSRTHRSELSKQLT